MEYLTCDPFTEGKTETVEFWERGYWAASEKLAKHMPSHIVIIESLHDRVVAALKEDYEEIFYAFHAHFTETPVGYTSNTSYLLLRKFS
jgi:hypothetical protein